MEEVTNAEVWVVCSTCGEKHQVLPGVGSPVYWCENRLMNLKEGDDIEYEEVKKEGKYE